MISDYQLVKDEILRKNRFIIASHVNPDGDSIGSMAALARILGGMDKSYIIGLNDKIPAKYTFLMEGLPVTDDISSFTGECLLALDSSDVSRLGGLAENIQNALIINIDHHISNRNYGDVNLVDAEAAATGEIIFNLLRLLPVSLDKPMAEALYTAISTDTGNFKFENTTAQTLAVASELLKTGFDLRSITRRTIDEMSLQTLCLVREALQALTLEAEGKIAHMSITDDILKTCGAGEEDMEGLINYAINIKGVELGLLFRPREDQVKVGFRSKTIDVSKMASSFGGGGHKRAAGCSIAGDLIAVKDKVLTEVTSYINK